MRTFPFPIDDECIEGLLTTKWTRLAQLDLRVTDKGLEIFSRGEYPKIEKVEIVE